MSTDQIAVRVSNVSKIYTLWTSPRERLLHPLRRIANSVLPAKLQVANENAYREFRALDDISFEIRKGESWGFIGVNGSGKSTLLKIISGNLRPSTGAVEVDGKVAILDYGSGFNGEFSGEENIHLKASLLGLTKKQISERFDAIVAFAELGEFIKQPVKTYSSGMSARLGFAIMAHVDADIIITDEALAVGDVFFVQKCMAFIRSFLEHGTFLFVSHSTNDVLSLCQKAVWLEHGKIKSIGSAKKVTSAYLGMQALARAENLKNEDQDSSEDLSSNGQSGATEVILEQPALSGLMKSKAPKLLKDARLEYLNRSPWRNDIQAVSFSFEDTGFGAGGARICDVTLKDETGATLSWIVGGEIVTLAIEVQADRELKSPIVGFQVKDRLGQSLFADNSYFSGIQQPYVVKKGTAFITEFVFQMPLLPVGDYVVFVAVALGAEEGNAVPLHVLQNAFVIRSVTSGPRHGLIGVPMYSIRIKSKTYSSHSEGLRSDVSA